MLGKKLVAVVAAALVAVALAAVAAAGGAASKQRIAIDSKGENGFVLTPLTRGSLSGDGGSVAFCCWTSRPIVRNGQAVDVTTGPRMTLLGKRGTLIASNRMEFLNVRGGYAVFTGTWKVVRGTGAYSGVSGGGRIAGVEPPNGDTRWRREGILVPAS